MLTFWIVIQKLKKYIEDLLQYAILNSTEIPDFTGIIVM